MYISSLTLNNFRNYEQEKIEFSSGTNLIYGNNAQGKTNILEAVYLFSQGRSHRAKTDKELIRFGCDFANLTATFHDSARDYSANIRLIKNGEHKDTVVCDFIACMTDRFAIATFKNLFIPSSWSIY